LTRSSCESLGEGKTSLFPGKERFFPPPSPHPFPEKSEVCCRSVVAAASTAQRAIKNGLSFYTIKLITSELAQASTSCLPNGKRFTLRSNASRRIYPALHVDLHSANQHLRRSVVAAASTAQRAIKNGLSFYTIKLITSELAKRALHVCRMANASHCEAMLHAGFILLFTLICGNANQHQAPTLFQRKAEYVLLPPCPAIALGDGGRSQNLSHPNSRSEHFMFAAG